MATVDAQSGGPPKKEAAVLSEASLLCLGRELGQAALRITMYLNVPTLTLVQKQLLAQAKNWTDADLGAQMLLIWKHQRESAKEKEKVLDLERALRDNDKSELADVVIEKHKDNAELTSDAFR